MSTPMERARALPEIISVANIRKQLERTINMKYEITYKEKNGLLYPDFVMPEQTHYPIGKYGSLRFAFIKEHRKGTYTTLLMQCRLNAYLYDIDITAKKQVCLITAQLAKSRGIDEKLKATDPLDWVAQMNSCKFIAEEIVMSEIIYQEINQTLSEQVSKISDS